jgi:DUF4097 and DUF4098 domain-containing protein YvlB
MHVESWHQRPSRRKRKRSSHEHVEVPEDQDKLPRPQSRYFQQGGSIVDHRNAYPNMLFSYLESVVKRVHVFIQNAHSKTIKKLLYVEQQSSQIEAKTTRIQAQRRTLS